MTQEVALKPTKIIISAAHASDLIKYITETCKNITTTLANHGYKIDIITILNSNSFNTKYKLPFRTLQDQEKFSIDHSIEMRKNLNNEVFLVSNLGAVKILTLEKSSDFNYICNKILKHFSFYQTNDPNAFIAKTDILQHTLPKQASYMNKLNEGDFSKITSATSDLHISIFSGKTISIFIDKDLQGTIIEAFQLLPAERIEETQQQETAQTDQQKLSDELTKIKKATEAYKNILETLPLDLSVNQEVTFFKAIGCYLLENITSKKDAIQSCQEGSYIDISEPVFYHHSEDISQTYEEAEPTYILSLKPIFFYCCPDDALITYGQNPMSPEAMLNLLPPLLTNN